MGEIAGTAHRIMWNELPQLVRAEIERRLGARVRSVASQSGGFSHGMAARLLLDDGRRAFAKAINYEDDLSGMYRTEAQTAARLPRTVPTPSVKFTSTTRDGSSWCSTTLKETTPRLDQPTELRAVLAMVLAIPAAVALGMGTHHRIATCNDEMRLADTACDARRSCRGCERCSLTGERSAVHWSVDAVSHSGRTTEPFRVAACRCRFRLFGRGCRATGPPPRRMADIHKTDECSAAYDSAS